MRRTKIVCTIGPASGNKLEELIKAGMDVARFNFSHGKYEEFLAWAKEIRKISEKLNKPVAILQDLQGPKIRVGQIAKEGLVLNSGDTVILVAGTKGNKNEIPVTYPTLIADINIGENILLADGLMELKVVGKKDDKLICKVLLGGTLYSGKGVNFPTSHLKISAITEKDKKDLKFGLENLDIDFLALSFVRSVEDILELKKLIKNDEKGIKIIAKIETSQAIKNFDKILEVVDGIMVARGDLGVELPASEVPLLQKQIIKKSILKQKPVITATEMLVSMVENSRPTRAEISDVANAVFDGTDAVMLSNETSIGKYPVEAVTIMAEVVETAEKNVYTHEIKDHSLDEKVKELLVAKDSLKITKSNFALTVEEAVSLAACELARVLNAKFIVTPTASGATPRAVASHRPATIIIALAANPYIARQLTLSWGIVPYVLPFSEDTDKLLTEAVELLKQKNLVSPGDKIVITAGHPVNKKAGTTNIVKVEVI